MTHDPNNQWAQPQQPPQQGYPQPGQPQQPPQQGYPQPGQPQQPPQQGPGGPPAALDPANIPEHLRARMQQGGVQDNELSSGAAIRAPKLSIKGKQFRFINGETETPWPLGQPLHVIILRSDPAKSTARAYYDKPFVDGQDQSPACASSDGVTPDAGVDSPQCSHCATCPWNAFGTAKNQDGTQGKGKACREFKRLYVIPYDSPEADVYELNVPVTSHKAMQQFGMQVNKAGLHIYHVVTTLDFGPETSPTLTFSMGGYVPAHMTDRIEERVNSADMDALMPSLNKNPADVPGGEAQPQAGQNALEGPAQPPASEPAPQPQQPPAQPAPPPQQPPQPTCPLGAPAGYVMTPKGGGVTYQQFIQANWTDQLLIEHGYMQAGA